MTTRIGESAPSFGLRKAGSIGQAVLQALELAGEFRQLAGLGVVSQRDEGFERGLGGKPRILVDLVRADGRFDRAIELHPRDVGRVVVVADERVGTALEEALRLGCVVAAAAARRCAATRVSSP